MGSTADVGSIAVRLHRRSRSAPRDLDVDAIQFAVDSMNSFNRLMINLGLYIGQLPILRKAMDTKRQGPIGQAFKLQNSQLRQL